MGLLDDAIREHLELKRRRGADPTEIEREEAEALGPVRRAAPAAEASAALDDGPYADEPAGLEDPGLAYADEPEAAPPAHEPEFDDRPAPDEGPGTHDGPYTEPE